MGQLNGLSDVLPAVGRSMERTDTSRPARDPRGSAIVLGEGLGRRFKKPQGIRTALLLNALLLSVVPFDSGGRAASRRRGRSVHLAREKIAMVIRTSNRSLSRATRGALAILAGITGPTDAPHSRRGSGS
jgi:hypothetical protein